MVLFKNKELIIIIFIFLKEKMCSSLPNGGAFGKSRKTKNSLDFLSMIPVFYCFSPQFF